MIDAGSVKVGIIRAIHGCEVCGKGLEGKCVHCRNKEGSGKI